MQISFDFIWIYMINIRFVALILHPFSVNELDYMVCFVCHLLSSKDNLISKLEGRDLIFLNLSLGKEAFLFRNTLFKHEIV